MVISLYFELAREESNVPNKDDSKPPAPSSTSEPFSKTTKDMKKPIDHCENHPNQGYFKSIREKISLFFREYGKIGIGVYIGVSSLTFFLCYLGVKAGIDLKSIADLLSISIPSWGDKAGGLLITYATYKLLLPIRLALTVAITPYIKRKFKL